MAILTKQIDFPELKYHFVDTHSHIYLEKFDDDRAAVIERAVKAGVYQMFLPNIDAASVDRLLRVCNEYSQHCLPAMGLHPSSINENYRNELSEIERVLQMHTFYAIGEIGIDLYWDKTYVNEQIEAFKIQLNWAKAYSLPVIIHARDSLQEIFQVLDDFNYSKLSGIFHCFSGTPEEAQKALSYGDFKLGIGGVVTFKKSKLGEVIQKTGIEHIVLETDAPYLAPTPYRGKRNESAYIPIIAQKIAELFDISVGKVADITTQNAIHIFKMSKNLRINHSGC